MTIQDTIPTWKREWALTNNDHAAKKIFESGQVNIYVDQYYTFSIYGPCQSDRYYFRIKLKQKQ